MGLLPPHHPVTRPSRLPSLLTPWTSRTRQHQSKPRLQSNGRSFFQPSVQSSRQQQPLTSRRRPPTVVRRKPTSKPKSGWNSWINISWGPKTPIWPLTLLHPQQVVHSFEEQVLPQLCLKMRKATAVEQMCLIKKKTKNMQILILRFSNRLSRCKSSNPCRRRSRSRRSWPPTLRYLLLKTVCFCSLPESSQVLFFKM